MTEHTVVVRANFQGLISTHNQAGLLVLLVLQESDIAGTTLLPLTRLAVELEKLCTHLKGLFLQLFIGLGLDFLGKVNDGLEVDFRRFDLLFSL